MIINDYCTLWFKRPQVCLTTQPVVLVKHFHLAEKHQSPDRGEILQVVHWAAEIRTTQGVNMCGHHTHTVQYTS